MPQNMQSMLNFVLGIKQLKEQQAEQAYKERTGTGAAVQNFIQDLSHVNSANGITYLKKHYNENYHISGATLDELEKNFAPTKEQMRDNLTAEHVSRLRQGAGAPPISPALDQLLNATATSSLTGALPGTVAQSGAQAGMINGAANAPGGFDASMRQGFLNQIFRNQTPSQAAVSDAGAALPAADQTQAAKIGMDLIPGAGNTLSATTQSKGQNLSYAASMAQIAQQHTAMLQQYGLETVNQAIEREKLKMMQAKGGGSLTAAEQVDATKAALDYLQHPGTSEGARQLSPALMNQLLNQAGLGGQVKAGTNVTDMPWKIGK